MRRSTIARRRKDPTFWKAVNRVLMMLTAVGLLGLIGLSFYPELERRNQMARELEQERQELARLQLLRKQREREVYILENDKDYIEALARDRLDMMREGETIYRLDSVQAPTAKESLR